jgi:lysophospholipase L1-like esterase
MSTVAAPPEVRSQAPKLSSGGRPWEAAGASTQIRYVALGDSYSSGQGVLPYDPGTNDRSDQCHRSRYAYPFQLALPGFMLERSFFACAGAAIENLVATSSAGVKSTLEYPGEHVVQFAHPQLARADLVTLTIGGNDAHFERALMACVQPADCNDYRHSENAPVSGRAGIIATARTLYPKLLDTFAELRRDVPASAAVLVLDYPQLFPAGRLPANCRPESLLFSSDVQRFLRHAEDVLDGTEAAAARAAGLQFVDVRRIFAGHETCARQGAWINQVLLRPTPYGPTVGEASLHPNRAGQAAYARAILDYVEAKIKAHARLTPKGLPADPRP